MTEAGAAVDNKEASVPEYSHTPGDNGLSPQSPDLRRQTARSRRRTYEENVRFVMPARGDRDVSYVRAHMCLCVVLQEAAPLTANRRGAAKRARTGDSPTSELPEMSSSAADASTSGTSATDAPISSRTRKRN